MELNYFNSIEQANEVLDHYENFFLRSGDVRYIAVVELKVGYGIEIGANYNSSIKPICIEDPIDIYLGNFDKDVIPTYLPVPSEFKVQMKSILTARRKQVSNCKEEEKEDIHISVSKTQMHFLEIKEQDVEERNKIFDNEVKALSQSEHYSSDDTKEKNDPWLNHIMGKMPIQNYYKNLGTLGGIFQILEYPDKLFGISNFHILHGARKGLGKSIYSPNDNVERGILFWSSLDIYREAAFIEFNCETKKQLLDRYNREDYQWIIEEPKIGMKVFHLGNTSGLNNLEKLQEDKLKEIRSINATVRQSMTQFHTSEERIFKNQILIHKNTEPGDSGSLVLTKEGNQIKVVGLNFGLLEGEIIDRDLNTKTEFSYSIANNINYIFNHAFKEKQEVHISTDEDNIITTSFAERFTLKNNELYK